MNYLYHSVPQGMLGNVLYPLNVLKTKHPDLYEKQAAKYVGREMLMTNVLPILNCLWNDVLHFTAIHPREIQRALSESGMSEPFHRSYYQIEPSMLDSKDTVVFLCEHDFENDISSDDCVPYHPADIPKYAIMPQAAKDYYRATIQRGERPFLYHMTPHILHRRSLDVSGLAIVTV